MNNLHLKIMSTTQEISGMMVQLIKMKTNDVLSNDTYELFQLYNHVSLTQLFHDKELQSKSFSEVVAEFKRINLDDIKIFFEDIPDKEIKDAYKSKFNILINFINEITLYIEDKDEKKILEGVLPLFYEKNSSAIDEFYLKTPQLNATFDDMG
jgi:hypothetical protein